MLGSLLNKSKPIWIKNKSIEKNVGLHFEFKLNDCLANEHNLLITGHTAYKVKLDNKTIHHGPARSNHGTYKVEEIPLSEHCNNDNHLLTIEIFGYNINGYAYLNAPSFLQFEIHKNKEVIVASNETENLTSYHQINNRIQKVQKYSYQRPFIESYSSNPRLSSCIIENVSKKELITSDVPKPYLFQTQTLEQIKFGTISENTAATLYKDRSLDAISDLIMGFKRDELELSLSDIISKLNFSDAELKTHEVISTNEFSLHQFECNSTGFLHLELEAIEDTCMVITFDEILIDQRVNPFRFSCCNAISFELKKGHHTIETFEPYTLKYLQLNILNGCLKKPANVSLINLNYGQSNDLSIKLSTPDLQKILKAAQNTFCQNVVDIPMDCPSRERSGWLCDSFFMGTTEGWYNPTRPVEKAFLNNIIRAEKFDFLPEHMLPMNYPADHYNSNFIPNWSLWYVIEIEEYFNKTKDNILLASTKEKIYNLFKYFDTFLNKDHLLEDLKGWVFVEWSKANKLVAGINYPSNMLYAKALEIAGNLYNDKSLKEKAKKTRDEILKQSFDGTFFHDQTLKKNDQHELQPDCTEVCQYYAFYFDLISPKTHPELWNLLLARGTETLRKLHSMNVLPGYILRISLLGKYGLLQEQLDDIKTLYTQMAETTGTLWEMSDIGASLNHGFNGILIHFFLQDQMGLSIDAQKNCITWSPPINLLNDGEIKFHYGRTKLKWKKQDNKIYYSIEADTQTEFKTISNLYEFIQTERP